MNPHSPVLFGFGAQLAAGTLVTAGLAAASLACGLVLGMAGAGARLSRRRLLRAAGHGYTTAVRGVPELLVVLIVYFGASAAVRRLAALFGATGYFELSPFIGGVLALSLTFGAYATEVLRGAFLAVPPQQAEAAQALGLSRLRALRHVLLPQVWRSALPGLGNLFLVLLKDTSAQERNCSQLHAGAVYLLLRRGAHLPRHDRAVHGGHAGAGAARRPRRGAGRLMATLADVVADSLPRLLEGAWLTVQLVVLALAAGTALALPLAGMRTARRWWLKAPAYGYLFFFRGTPLLVQIFLVYYGLAQFAAVRDSFLWPILREPYWCAVIAFGLNTAAYTAEIIRGGMQAVARGELEAAWSLGLSRWQALRLIVLPRAVRQALPAYGNEVILMLKGSALASTITLLDLTGVARTIIARTYLAVELFALAGLIYLILTMLIVRGVRLLERRLRGVTAARIR